MHGLRKVMLGVLGLLCAAGGSGCQFLHELQPYRLQRWNRGAGMQSGYEAYYSVADPLPRDESASSEGGAGSR